MNKSEKCVTAHKLYSLTLISTSDGGMEGSYGDICIVKQRNYFNF